jgi:hypothetical protein
MWIIKNNLVNMNNKKYFNITEDIKNLYNYDN